ncbi:MAG TPA: hypothetical protein VK932_10185 [Kofleriaceae bacterium]|nr:hypothetical protein [Kofleriaceae bacterium]
MTIPAAQSRATAIRAGEAPEPPTPAAPRRVLAIGDPQTSTERFFGALAAHGLLGEDGWLRADARLISMGDHFDYHERERARVEGVLVLGWLAAHARDHVQILAGNHDLSRVMELAAVDDARFLAAGDLARAIRAAPEAEQDALEAEFHRRFPEIATPGYAGRDYNAFTVEQRALVQRLLLDERFDLALAARTQAGLPLLLTHAGVTVRQLAELGLPDERDPHALAGALNARLRAAVTAVAADWRAGRETPLSLEPLHVAGADGAEGGGLLYHRPADPERPGADASWESGARASRRYHPRDLPRGLAQVIGHTGHRKAYQELPRWREPGMDDRPGGLRTLRVSRDGAIEYRRGTHPPADGDALAWMIDPEMHHVPTAADVALLELAAVASDAPS